MQTTMRALVLLWLLGLPCFTHARVAVWHSEITLWSDASYKAPWKARPIMNYGRARELAGDSEFSEHAYRLALSYSLDPRRTEYDRKFTQAAAETNLAHLAMKVGKLATAMEIIDGTLQQWPEFPYAHYNRGSILWAVGMCEDAKLEYAIARYGDPALPAPVGDCAPYVEKVASANP